MSGRRPPERCRVRRKDSPEEKHESPTKAVPTKEQDTAQGRPVVDDAPVPRAEGELAKARTVPPGTRRGGTADKRARPASGTSKRKPAPGGKAADLPPEPSAEDLETEVDGEEEEEVEALSDLPLGPEAMSRIRRTVDRPGTQAAMASPAPRDRSRGRKEGLQELDWQGVADASKELARQIARKFSPDLVVGLAKGGVFAGQEIANALGCPFVAVRVHPRSRDHGPRSPEAAANLPSDAEGKRLLIVDDIAGTGATLQRALEAARGVGSLDVKTATLVVRDGGYRPDFFGVETGDLVVFPWDYEPSSGAVGDHDGDPGDFGV